MNFFLVFLGGGLGAMVRYGLSRLIPFSTSGFPFPTLAANIISCIILGCLLGLTSQNQLDSKGQFLLITGFCGGFSTFSTFSAETFSLFQNGQHFLALGYIAVSVIVCLFSIFVGLKLVG